MHDQRGSIGWVAAFAVLGTTIIGLLSAWIGWLIAGGITLAVDMAVAVCIALFAVTALVLVKSGVLHITTHLPHWLDRLERTTRDAPKMSDDLRDALSLAAEEARHFHRDRVGTEHLMLGLIRQNGHAARALTHCGITLEALIRATDLIGRGGTSEYDGVPPLSIAAVRLLDEAGKCARDEHARFVQTRHLLTALVADEHGTAAIILEHLGCTHATAASALRATRDRAER